MKFSLKVTNGFVQIEKWTSPFKKFSGMYIILEKGMA
jgi:hypothetical protein